MPPSPRSLLPLSHETVAMVMEDALSFCECLRHVAILVGDKHTDNVNAFTSAPNIEEYCQLCHMHSKHTGTMSTLSQALQTHRNNVNYVTSAPNTQEHCQLCHTCSKHIGTMPTLSHAIQANVNKVNSVTSAPSKR